MKNIVMFQIKKNHKSQVNKNFIYTKNIREKKYTHGVVEKENALQKYNWFQMIYFVSSFRTFITGRNQKY